jgi:hypothetical protein
MNVVIGSTGMQQGLAFYQRLLLLKVFVRNRTLVSLRGGGGELGNLKP